MLKRLLDDRWFYLGELISIMAAAGLGWWQPGFRGQPGLNYLPLLIVALPWIVRLVAGSAPSMRALQRRALLDFPCAFFVLTAAIGTWAAYDRELAWAKFWVLLSAVLLYFTLSRQPEANLWYLVGFMSAMSAALTLYFLLTNDWQAQQTKLDFIQRVGIWWMSVRPALQAPPLHPNTVASFLAVLFPFQLALLAFTWKQHRALLSAAAAMTAGMSITGLLLTASRGALLTSGAVLGISIVWLFCRFLARRTSWQTELIFGMCVAPLLVAGLGFALLFPGGPVRLLDMLPGPASAYSRLEIARNTLQLVADFPFTGGGLRAFPGLYAHYILVIPYLYLGYSHNLFLETAVEQGLFGLLALGVIFTGTFWRLCTSLRARPGWLGWAALASLAVMCLHGLVTDAIYSEAGSPILFLQAGIAAALVRPVEGKEKKERKTDPDLMRRSRQNIWSRQRLLGTAAAGLTLVVMLALVRKPLLSKWYANLGAVEMARIELADFPSGHWDEGQNLASLAEAESYFLRSLFYQPANSTASYRLGLIEAQRRNFPRAVAYLETASQASPSHRGIQKVLGYNYTWVGQPERAAVALVRIQEARDEMFAYTWWWETLGREDLAQAAQGMVERLQMEN